MPDEPEELQVEDARPVFEPPAIQNLPDGDAPPKRRRGRPKGSRNRPRFDEAGNPIGSSSGRTPAIHYGNKRDSTEVSKRLQSIMVGGTGILSVVRPHFQMRDEEAKDIADPLTSYLLRQEQFSPRIREFLDKYDIVAAALAFITYLVRVWVDDTNYRNAAATRNRAETVVDSTARPTEQGGGESSGKSDGERSEIDGGFSGISTPIPPR